MKKVIAVMGAALLVSMAQIVLAADTIIIEGSTTVLPIAQGCAEAFMNQKPGVDISVRGGGSGVGVASMIEGRCDIGDASRAMKDKEVKKALEKGITPKPNVVAMDGIAVIVNPSNGMSAITKEQIKAIYTGKISQWSEVGGEGGTVVVISRDSASGTFEAFNSLVLDKERVRPDALLSASNKAIATTVAETPGAIGYVGMGYLTSAVKALTVDGIDATTETVLSGEYPLARPLFMYTNGEPKGAVKEFLDFVMSPEGQKIVSSQGFVSLK